MLTSGSKTTSTTETNADSTNGVGIQGSVGYAFWLGESFNLALEANAGVARVHDIHANYLNCGLGFHWY